MYGKLMHMSLKDYLKYVYHQLLNIGTVFVDRATCFESIIRGEDEAFAARIILIRFYVRVPRMMLCWVN